MWFLLALLSALLAAVRRASEKQLSNQLHYFTIGWTIQLLSLPFITLVWLLSGDLLNPLHLSAGFWVPMLLIWFGFYPLNMYLYITALQHGELSKILPLQSLSPVFALLLAWLMLGEQPSLLAAAAVMVIVAGVYTLNITGRRLHNPLHSLIHDKANRYSLLNILQISLVAVLDKQAIEASEPLYFSFVSTVGAVVVLYACARAYRVSETAPIRQHIRPLAIAGSFFGASFCLAMLALDAGPLAYVTATRVGASILIGALIGFWYLREPVTRPKLAGLGLILSGGAFLGLFG